jgi:hypothetical protein
MLKDTFFSAYYWLRHKQMKHLMRASNWNICKYDFQFINMNFTKLCSQIVVFSILEVPVSIIGIEAG